MVGDRLNTTNPDAFYTDLVIRRDYSVDDFSWTNPYETNLQITDLWYQDLAVSLHGDDSIQGGGGDDLIYGNGGNDYLAGGSGNDTYFYSLGDGMDVIDLHSLYAEDPNISRIGEFDTIELGSNISASDIVFQGDSNNLLINFSDGGRIQVNDYFSSPIDTVINLHGGSTWTRTDVQLLVSGSTPGENPIVATSTGSDETEDFTMLAAQKSGSSSDLVDASIVAEQDSMGEAATSLEIVKFSTNVSSDDVVVSRSGGDLILEILASEELLTIREYFSKVGNTVHAFEFADGTVWDRSSVEHRVSEIKHSVENTDQLDPQSAALQIQDAMSSFGAAGFELEADMPNSLAHAANETEVGFPREDAKGAGVGVGSSLAPNIDLMIAAMAAFNKSEGSDALVTRDCDNSVVPMLSGGLG